MQWESVGLACDRELLALQRLEVAHELSLGPIAFRDEGRRRSHAAEPRVSEARERTGRRGDDEAEE